MYPNQIYENNKEIHSFILKVMNQLKPFLKMMSHIQTIRGTSGSHF